MTRESKFKLDTPFEKRLSEARSIMSKYPDRIPCIIEIDKEINQVTKKMLVPADLTVSQLLFILRKKTKFSPEKALFLFLNNIIPPSGTTVGYLYPIEKNDDNFLYFFLTSENSFGNSTLP